MGGALHRREKRGQGRNDDSAVNVDCRVAIDVSQGRGRREERERES